MHPCWVAKLSTGFGWNVTSAGWQVTLCDPIWHVSSSSGVATSVSELLYPCYITLLYFTRCRDHITPVLQQLHWLPVQRRVEFKIACLVHQSLALRAPTYTCLQTFILPPSMVAISAHLDIDHSLFHGREPPSVTSFTVAGPRLWNSLPATLRQITSYGQFRRHLKTHSFRA